MLLVKLLFAQWIAIGFLVVRALPTEICFPAIIFYLQIREKRFFG